MTKLTSILSLAMLAAALPAQAAQGDVLVRVRTILVAPNEKSGGILPSLGGEKVAVGNSFMPELDFTYMATNHLGFELILATTKHKLSGRTGTTGGIGKLGSTWVLPPTLTAQYHFVPEGHVRPYVGAGINYSVFWNEDASGGLEAAVGRTRIHMSDSVGWALQAGTDIDLSKRVFLNLDIKYIDMRTTARLATGAIGVQRVKVDINPIVAGVGLGFRF
jgi:outer membrane protein